MKKESTSVTIFKGGKEDIPEMLQEVTRLIKKIKGNLPETPKITNELSGHGKIAEIETLDGLIKAASTIKAKERAYNDIAKDITPFGLKTPTFALNGHSAKQWIDYIKTTAILVGNKEKLKKLNDVKVILERNLSDQDKFKNDMALFNSILHD